MTERNGVQHSIEDSLRLLDELRPAWLEMWQRVRMDWSFASGGLSASLRKRLRSSERRIVSEAIYGLIRRLSLVDEGLVAGGAGRADPKLDAMRLVAYLVLCEGLPIEDAARQFSSIDWGRVAGIEAVVAREPKLARRIARMRSLPRWFAETLVAEFGEEAEALAAGLDMRAPATMRVNTLVTARAAALERLAEADVVASPGALSSTAITLATNAPVRGAERSLGGALEPQDEGSQLVVELVQAEGAGVVVDYCAGAGGKTLGLAAVMENRGRLVAVDMDSRKLGELKRRARRAGVTNVHTMSLERDGEWPRALSTLQGSADRVLVDAPCTGTGSLRRNPELRWRIQPDEPQRYARRQLSILVAAADLVAPGARLIYVTCSVLAAENAAVVRQFLDTRAGFAVVPVNQLWTDHRAELCDSSGQYLELLPHRHGTDGFFAAVFERRDVAK